MKITISKEKFENIMNLLLYQRLNKFMYNQTKNELRKHFCMYCLQCFSSDDVLNNHKTNCMVINGKQAIKVPDKDNNILKFNNFHKQLPVPFVIYRDFEAITEKVQGCLRQWVWV